MVTQTFAYNTSGMEPFAAADKQLLVQWSTQFATIVLSNQSTHRGEAVEIFQLSGDWSEDWEAMLEKSALVKLRDVPTTFIYGGKSFLPIPTEIWQPQGDQGVLDELFGETPETSFSVSDKVANHQMVMHWRMPLGLHEAVSNHFSVTTFRHLCSYLLHQTPLSQGGVIVFAGQEAFVHVFANNKLLYTGCLPISSADDLAYRLLNIGKVYEVDAQSLPWFWSGMLEQKSDLHRTLHQFLPQWQPLATSQQGSDEDTRYYAHLLNH